MLCDTEPFRNSRRASTMSSPGAGGACDAPELTLMSVPARRKVRRMPLPASLKAPSGVSEDVVHAVLLEAERLFERLWQTLGARGGTNSSATLKAPGPGTWTKSRMCSLIQVSRKPLFPDRPFRLPGMLYLLDEV